jgi:hypothetical protein
MQLRLWVLESGQMLHTLKAQRPYLHRPDGRQALGGRLLQEKNQGDCISCNSSKQTKLAFNRRHKDFAAISGATI